MIPEGLSVATRLQGYDKAAARPLLGHQLWQLQSPPVEAAEEKLHAAGTAPVTDNEHRALAFSPGLPDTCRLHVRGLYPDTFFFNGSGRNGNTKLQSKFSIAQAY